MEYLKVNIGDNTWVIVEAGKDWRNPEPACTFAFDTETLVYLDNELVSQQVMHERLKGVKTDEKRRRLHNVTWAWQIYDEINGFFMTNNFECWLYYQCKAKHKFGWCYNATFDFAQIDYELLGKTNKWTPHENGKANTKGQKWTYQSIHNDSGARYCYKLWIPYKANDRHTYTHAVEYRDFMKLLTGGLANVLKGLDVKDNDGNPIRKLEMDYQAVDPNNLTQSEIDYCCNDVKGLYFAIKQFNSTIEEQSNGELHIFGDDTNVMTAGGIAKSELLRSLYPYLKTKSKRVKEYQKQHPITEKQDKWVRDNHLYRGGICFVNPNYKGKLLTSKEFSHKMNRYDVNSEYPYAMSVLQDLVGKPQVMSLHDWLKVEDKDNYECIYMLSNVCGTLRPNMLGVWYDPFRRDFVDEINENGLHLMFERELLEYSKWYDLDYQCEQVLVYKRGDYAYKPFVDENYTLKANAKREGNKLLEKFSKLNLNSGYGKLAERLERRIGHYELNKDTGAIHFVEDGVEIDDTSALNVVIGALVTCIARCYILSQIRAVCSNVAEQFVYIDTDSIHAFADYDKADAFSLGGLKLEAECEAVKYLAPKTYIDIECVDDIIGTIEIHTKGVSTKVVYNDFKAREDLTIDYVNDKFNYGAKYIILCAMNVVGGKVLVPTEKYLARPELAPNEQMVLTSGYDGQYLMEI